MSRFDSYDEVPTFVEDTSKNPEPTIYPNPFKNSFSLKLPGDYDEVDIYIRSMDGKLIKQYKHIHIQGLEFGSGLTKGMFLVEVVYKDNRTVTKLVKY